MSGLTHSAHRRGASIVVNLWSRGGLPTASRVAESLLEEGERLTGGERVTTGPYYGAYTFSVESTATVP